MDNEIIMEEAREQLLKCLKYKNLIETFKELGWEINFEYEDEYCEIETEYIELDGGRSTDQLISKDLIKLYEILELKIRKEAQKEERISCLNEFLNDLRSLKGKEEIIDEIKQLLEETLK